MEFKYVTDKPETLNVFAGAHILLETCTVMPTCWQIPVLLRNPILHEFTVADKVVRSTAAFKGLTIDEQYLPSVVHARKIAETNQLNESMLSTQHELSAAKYMFDWTLPKIVQNATAVLEYERLINIAEKKPDVEEQEKIVSELTELWQAALSRRTRLLELQKQHFDEFRVLKRRFDEKVRRLDRSLEELKQQASNALLEAINAANQHLLNIVN